MLKPIITRLIMYSLTLLFSTFYIAMGIIRLFKCRNRPVEQIDISCEPSCLRDPTLGSHATSHVKSRDMEVHYVANGDKSKPLMLFLHGFPEFWYTWKYQLKEFGNNYYAVAMDMTGYGGTSKPVEKERYNLQELATDVKEFVLELGFKSCVLVGHDWGGGVAYTVAEIYPEIVDKLIVINCPNKRGFSKGFGLRQLLRSSYMFYFQVPLIPEYFLSARNCSALDSLRKGPMAINNSETFTKEDLTAYKYTFLKGGFTEPLNYYRMSLKLAFAGSESKPKRNKCSVPTLIVWGKADTVSGCQLATYTAESLENCQLKFVEGGHFVNVENPDEVNKHMSEYLQKS